MIQSFASVAAGVPTVVVGSIFQKEPQVFIAHPDQGFDKFEDLKKSPAIFVSKDGLASYYQWLKAEHGFREEQVKPYTFNAQPFLADKKSVMQGYLSSEPYLIEKTAGFKPVVFLLADQGFDTYSTTIDTRLELIQQKPDVVKRFIEASIIGPCATEEEAALGLVLHLAEIQWSRHSKSEGDAS